MPFDSSSSLHLKKVSPECMYLVVGKGQVTPKYHNWPEIGFKSKGMGKCTSLEVVNSFNT